MTSKIKTSKKELASEKIKSLLAKAKEKREMAKGGKIKEVDFENSNLILYGFGKDTNGNSIVKIGFPNQRAFSIQTNNIGLETSHNKRGYAVHELDQKEIDSIEKEVVEYLKENGTKEQKAKLKTYSTYSDGGMMADGGEISEYEVIINKGSKNERVLADFATKKIAENFVYDYGLKHPKAKLSICKVDEKSHKMSKGGHVDKHTYLNPPENPNYMVTRDAQRSERAKPSGYRYTNEGAKRLKIDNPKAYVTEEHKAKYKGKYFTKNGVEHRYIYIERRADKADMRRNAPYLELGGTMARGGAVGGNSGYVGYSMSKRAAQAYDDGKLTYSKLPIWAKRMVDSGMATTNEWHHTSSYGNKTSFFNVQQFFDHLTDQEREKYNIEEIESFKDVPKPLIKDIDEKAKAQLKKKNNIKEVRKGYVDAAKKALQDFNAKFKTYSRVSKSPEYGLTDSYEMEGKFGWFPATSRYNLPEYKSGINYETEENLKKAIQLKSDLDIAERKPIYRIELSKRGFTNEEIDKLKDSGIITSEIMPESFYNNAEVNKDIIKKQIQELSELPNINSIYRPYFNKYWEEFLTDNEKQARQDYHQFISEQGQNFGSSYERRMAHENNDIRYRNIADERLNKAKEEFLNSDAVKEQEEKFNHDKQEARNITENLQQLFNIDTYKKEMAFGGNVDCGCEHSMKQGGKLSNQYAKGGRVGKDTYLNPPENPSYMISRDAQRSERAKPSGWRYTNAGAKRLKIDNTKAYPSKEHIEKYKGKYFTDRDGVEHRYIYIERRADKADMRRGKPYLERGGGIPNNYEGKTARTIWNEWELSQRKHFLEDHNVNPKGIIALNWEQLSDNHEDVIRKINEHIHEGEYKHGGEIEDNYNEDDTFHKGDKINKKTTGEKAEVIHLNTGGNHLLESYLVRKDNGETAYWWASDMEICYECGGRMERGGSIESQNKEIEEDEIGENINVFGYQTEHFINCPKAVSEFKKAIEEIITSYAVDSVDYTKESEALIKAARELDVILRLEEIIGENKEYLTIDTVKSLNTALKLFYIYNYKSGLRIESDFIAQHLYNIFDVEGEATLEYEIGGSIESQNKEMVSIKAKEIKHHAKELMESLKGDEEVPAWVVAKIERSATDISDAAHYLEGVENEEFERGGEIGIDDKNIEEGYHKTMVTKFNTYYTDDSDGIIMYRNQDGHKFGGGAMVEGEFIDDILNDRAIWINEDDKENIELIKEEQGENVGIEDNEPFAKGGLLNSAKSLLNKTKESVKSGYNKSKKYTEQKIHDKKRDIAYNVLQSTRNKVKDKKESQILNEASNIVDANYEKGGTTFKEKVEYARGGMFKGSYYVKVYNEGDANTLLFLADKQDVSASWSYSKLDDSFTVIFEKKLKVTDDMTPMKKELIEKQKIKMSDGGMMAKGGTTFKEKVAAITNRLNGTKVKPKYKKEYGSTYDKKEAKEAATKIAGKMIRREKMSNGGKITNEEWIKIEPVISKTYDYIIQVSAVQKRLLSAKDLWGDGTIFKPLTFKQFEVVHRNIKEITTDNPNFKW